MTSPAASASWRDHPVIVAAGAVAATLALAILAVKEIVLPTHTAGLTNQLTELSSLKLSNVEQEKKIKKLEAKLAQTESDLVAIQHTNLFAQGSPYPSSLEKVRIGYPVDTILTSFPDTAIEKKDGGFWIVKPTHGIFRQIVYYFDEASKNHAITHIAFVLDYKLGSSDSFLQDRLTATLGLPTSNPKATFFSWKTKESGTVYKSFSDRFIIMQSNSSPGYWPEQSK